MATVTTCEAAWEGGHCDREGKYQTPRGKLCPAHYQQVRRGGPFTPLRGKHGQLQEEVVQETVRVPTRYRDAAQEKADARGVDRAEIYREAIAAYFDAEDD